MGYPQLLFLGVGGVDKCTVYPLLFNSYPQVINSGGVGDGGGYSRWRSIGNGGDENLCERIGNDG